MNHRRPRGRAAIKYRRSSHLVVFWRRGALVAFNYATNQTVGVTPLIIQILGACDDWQPMPALQRELASQPPELVAMLVEQICAVGLLERSDRGPDPRAAAMSALGRWNPEAGFFHMATRDVAFSSPQQIASRARRPVKTPPMPPPVKCYPQAPQVDLPQPDGAGEFPQVLKSRRTWRRYGSAPVTLAELATTLGLTAGVQLWVGDGRQRSALKTSPSGGARHAIECYVAVRDVSGLEPGIYHYRSDRHRLERIGPAVPVARLKAYLPHSGYFAGASAMVFFTAVFARIHWRYPYSRAYRAALVEAGHVCQTFCLTATWLRLAPYCVMGLADTLIEQDLGIDGISEAVLYAAGVGRPPRGAEWGPLPRGPQPPIRRNRHLG